MLYILNGISVSMFDTFPITLKIHSISNSEVIKLVDNIGRDNTIAVINRKNVAQDISNLLDIPINLSRKRINIEFDDTVIIARHTQSTEKVDDSKLVIPKKSNISFYIVFRN